LNIAGYVFTEIDGGFGGIIIAFLVFFWSGIILGMLVATKWTPENPAKGQCGVTALVMQALLGGEILKTPMAEGWHYYNRVAGQRLDFTASQFAEEPDYQDLPSHREEAFSDTNAQQYAYLRSKVIQALNQQRRDPDERNRCDCT